MENIEMKKAWTDEMHSSDGKHVITLHGERIEINKTRVAYRRPTKNIIIVGYIQQAVQIDDIKIMVAKTKNAGEGAWQRVPIADLFVVG